MGLLDASQLPNLDILGIFMYHFIFTAWAMLDELAVSCLFYNTIFLITIMWCIKESQIELPLILAIRINIVCVLFDTWFLFYGFHSSLIGGFVFVGKMLNFFLRFLTIPLLSKICSDKTGGINDGLPTPLVPLFGVDHGISSRDPYENIDSVPHQSYPKSEPVISPSGSYSFSSNVPTYQAQA